MISAHQTDQKSTKVLEPLTGNKQTPATVERAAGGRLANGILLFKHINFIILSSKALTTRITSN
jgi:hypothetical protein